MSRLVGAKLMVLAVVLILSGCSSDNIYRSSYTPCVYSKVGDCSGSALQINPAAGKEVYRLGFIEYDDQGQLRDPAQMNAVLDSYRMIAGQEDVLLITYVHGWHHSAAPGDTNVASFRKLLEKISSIEEKGSEQQNRRQRRILGLFIGWRGDSLTVPYLNDLTFWDRKNTAHKVGLQGVTEALLKLEQIVNVKAGIEEENPPPINSRLVVIGHSFGGAVVYSSLQKVLVDRFIDSRRGVTVQGDANGFGDLVVLMNPAFEALRFASLYDLSQESCRHYFPSQLPKLAILSSETDYANKIAFPTGRIFSTLFESHLSLDRHYCSAPGQREPLEIPEGKADRTAVGHFKPYLTHRLLPADNMAAATKDDQVMSIKTSWSTQQYGDTLDFEGSKLLSLGRTDPLNPYLNIKVDEALMDGHNDIWGDRIIAFLRDMIVISTTPGSQAE